MFCVFSPFLVCVIVNFKDCDKVETGAVISMFVAKYYHTCRLFCGFMFSNVFAFSASCQSVAVTVYTVCTERKATDNLIIHKHSNKDTEELEFGQKSERNRQEVF